MSEFLTWDYLLTFGGCMAATAVLTQFVKKAPFLQKIDSQFISYVIAVIILVVAQVATGTISWSLVALDIFNGVVVSFAANGVYDATKSISAAVTNATNG